jgi:DNA-binding ferritin-like protein (Dps family)
VTTRKELNQRNNELHRLLNEENDAIVNDMVVYLRVSPRLSDYQVELIRQDLLDMALSAQARGVPLSEVFGEDYKGFCDEIINNVRPQGYIRGAFQWLSTLSLGIAILSVIDFVFSGYIVRVYHDILSHSSVDLKYPITAGFVVGTLVIIAVANLIVYLIGKYAFDTGKLPALSRPKQFALGCLAGGCAIGYVLGTYYLDKYVLVSINVFVYLVLVLALFLLYMVISRRLSQPAPSSN